ncbi:MAG: (4Fe-4S)-binding protein [Fodinibius sp.]|nr:(4Fe-4S)-binding protein [Fodinibius sp.]
MDQKIDEFEGDEITVTYDRNRCIHSAECVKTLPSVFDPDEKPWIQVDNDSAEKVKEAVHHCPTGALQYHNTDEEEKPSRTNTITIGPDGPCMCAVILKSRMPRAKPSSRIRA